MKSSKYVLPMVVALTLAAMLGGCSKSSSPTGLDSLDQAPPSAPTQITAEVDASTSNAVVEWVPSPSANVAGCEVYQYSPSPERESAYVLVATTDANTTRYYNVQPMHKPTTLYYRLRTVSATGVKSEWSTLVQVAVGPSLPDDPDAPRPAKH